MTVALPLVRKNSIIDMYRTYTTNPTECSAAATKHSTSESDLESSVEFRRAMAEQVCRALDERSGSARWDSTGGCCRVLGGISGVVDVWVMRIYFGMVHL